MGSWSGIGAMVTEMSTAFLRIGVNGLPPAMIELPLTFETVRPGLLDDRRRRKGVGVGVGDGVAVGVGDGVGLGVGVGVAKR